MKFHFISRKWFRVSPVQSGGAFFWSGSAVALFLAALLLIPNLAGAADGAAGATKGAGQEQPAVSDKCKEHYYGQDFGTPAFSPFRRDEQQVIGKFFTANFKEEEQCPNYPKNGRSCHKS